MDILKKLENEKPTEHVLVKPSVHRGLKDLSHIQEIPITQLVESALITLLTESGQLMGWGDDEK
jgi:hypothetical protein